MEQNLEKFGGMVMICGELSISCLETFFRVSSLSVALSPSTDGVQSAILQMVAPRQPNDFLNVVPLKKSVLI